ncbi:MAG: endonuclease NucS domain-containing protein [Paracoccaceae bacterium]
MFESETDPAPLYDLSEITTQEADGNTEADQEDHVERLGEIDAEELREFAYERDLQNFLAKNIELIEPGLRLYEEEGFQGVEFPAGGRRIDLLAVDKEERLVVIELKASRAYDRVVGQTARYMTWVQQNIDTDKPVRGIIIAHQITEDLRLAAAISKEIGLMEYKLKFEITKVNN